LFSVALGLLLFVSFIVSGTTQKEKIFDEKKLSSKLNSNLKIHQIIKTDYLKKTMILKIYFFRLWKKHLQCYSVSCEFNFGWFINILFLMRNALKIVGRGPKKNCIIFAVLNELQVKSFFKFIIYTVEAA